MRETAVPPSTKTTNQHTLTQTQHNMITKQRISPSRRRELRLDARGSARFRSLSVLHCADCLSVLCHTPSMSMFVADDLVSSVGRMINGSARACARACVRACVGVCVCVCVYVCSYKCCVWIQEVTWVVSVYARFCVDMFHLTCASLTRHASWAMCHVS